MTPGEAALLHKVAFAPERGWIEQEFRDLLGNPHVSLHTARDGLALVTTVAREAELLTLAVHPRARRNGTGSHLMKEWMAAVDADTAVLEVAADNIAALALYLRFGFAQTGRRKGYYRRSGGPAVDALLMKAALRTGNAAESPDCAPKTG